MTHVNRSLAITIVLAGLVACGEPASFERPPSPSVSSTRPASTGKLTVIEPAFDATVAGPTLDVKLGLEGATIAKKASRKLRPDTGHIHVKLKDLGSGEEKTLTLLAGLNYRITELEPGDYLLRVEFAANDHGSFNPPVLADVPFTVE